MRVYIYKEGEKVFVLLYSFLFSLPIFILNVKLFTNFTPIQLQSILIKRTHFKRDHHPETKEKDIENFQTNAHSYNFEGVKDLLARVCSIGYLVFQ